MANALDNEIIEKPTEDDFFDTAIKDCETAINNLEKSKERLNDMMKSVSMTRFLLVYIG